MMKRFGTLLLAVVMVLSCLPMGVFAASEEAYYVAGSSSLCGSNWSNNDPNNQMTLNADGLYEKTYENIPAGTYELKVTNGTWDACWGDNGNNYVLTVDAISNVTVLFDETTEKITTEIVPTGATQETVENVTIHYYNSNNWEIVYGYSWNTATNATLNGAWPGSPVAENADNAGWYTMELTGLNAESGVGFVFNNGNGGTGNQSNDIIVIASGEYWYDGKLLTEAPEGWNGGEEIVTNTYIIAGTPIFGTEWDTTNEANKMDYNKAKALYFKKYENVAASTAVQFKVTDGTWVNNWGNGGSNYEVTVTENSDVTIWFNEATKEITVDVVPTGDAGEEPETMEKANAVEVKVHYIRGDGNFDGWDVFQWGGTSVTAFEKVSDTEAVATIVTGSKSGDIGFIVRYGGDSWTDREWVDSNTGDRTVTGLGDILSGTVHVYVDHAYPADTRIELGDDVIREGEEHVDFRIHYIREDGNFDGWDVFQWGGISATAFEKVSDTEAVATITAGSNPGDIGFIVRYGGDSWTDREWVTSTSGDRTISGLGDMLCGTVDVYVDHANPAETLIKPRTGVYGTGEAPAYDIEIKVHYYREDGNYADWEVHMWNGAAGLSATRAFEREDVSYEGTTYGATATYYADASDTWVGFIVKKPDWTKDPDGDRKIDISNVLSGTVHVYAKSGSALEDFATDKSEATLGAKITAAVFDTQTGILTVTTSMPIEGDVSNVFTLEGPDGEMTITGVQQVENTSSYVVSYEGEITRDAIFTVYYNGAPCVVTVPNIYSTEAFEAEFTYTGDDLGFTYTEQKTTFRLWAPTASAASVNLYTTGSDAEEGAANLETYKMAADVNGTWTVTIEGDLKNVYYTYSVTRNGETVEACDPYARATGVNGDRAMVIDLDSTDPEGWQNDTYVTQANYTDAVIWELHVRDFSIDESSGVTEANRGKYLAFTEEGTTVPGTDISTGVDYMAELGINYVHLLPVYDINSVDETVGGYNWGYDPKNYNVPEGSYSSDPYNGTVRVNEFKQMVQSLHDNNIGVIMDVVYNHVADGDTFCFNQIVPGYFSRIHDDGLYQTNSGCGNDTASERAMVRKYIVDSVLYWAEEYHIDGFRWDLVGLIDYETINEVMAEVHAVNPDIIFYGEGWEMCSWTTKEGYTEKMTIQANDAMVNNGDDVFAFFNDTVRNGLHGGVFTVTDKGWVAGNTGFHADLVDGFQAKAKWGSSGTTDTPLQTVNYASCHDNYTLFDNLTVDAMGIYGGTAEEVFAQAVRMNNLAAAYYMTAQGIPFIHAGEEMLRSKPDAQQENGFNHNSYASGDEINSIKWSNLQNAAYAQNVAYYAGLIDFRAAHSALRLTTSAAVAENVKFVDVQDDGIMIFAITEGENTIYIIFNAKNAAYTATLPEGEWDVYVKGAVAGTEVIETVSGNVDVEAVSTLILVQEAEEEEPSKPTEPEETEPEETKPEETKPEETKPEETKPEETKPEETKPEETEPEEIENPFEDISEDLFCYDAVLWAYENNITTGKDATHFNPSGNCTRSQVVTFLWRAAGEPEPKSDVSFPDVPEGKFYTKAVAWAVEEGITNGFKDGTFGPDKTCTRGQIVTFLWRYAGEPEAEAESAFPDVDLTTYCGDAVLWAVEEGITTGYKNGTFGPDKTCKRDQIVTFLYRYLAENK